MNINVDIVYKWYISYISAVEPCIFFYVHQECLLHKTNKTQLSGAVRHDLGFLLLQSRILKRQKMAPFLQKRIFVPHPRFFFFFNMYIVYDLKNPYADSNEKTEEKC